jgi:hypothetical protein
VSADQSTFKLIGIGENKAERKQSLIYVGFLEEQSNEDDHYENYSGEGEGDNVDRNIGKFQESERDAEGEEDMRN